MYRYLSTFALCAITAFAAHAADPAGRWQGAIELPNGELGITVVLSAEEAGWTGTIDIPLQNVRGFALSGIVVEGPRVHFEMAGIPGQPTFEGELSEGGDALAGTFRQGSQELPFGLARAAEGTGEAEDETPSGLPEEPVPGEGLTGDWLGVLQVGPVTLRLALHVEEAANGALNAVVDSVDQGAVIPVDAITLDDEGRVRLVLDRIAASFAGRMHDDGSAIPGTWAQGGQELPLTLHRLAAPFALKRPQEPEAPFPYSSRDVTFESAGGVTLAGTLLIPKGEGPFPAVALVSGSGPQDRNEALMGHKPFLVIADDLARRGIASLRWDDRGAGESTGDHMGSTVREFAADVEAAVAFLAAQPAVDRGAIGIVGHSEGGLSGPIAAVGNDRVAFLVLLAPPGVPMRSLLIRQARDIYGQQGLEAEMIDRLLAMQAEDLELVEDPSLTDEQLQEKLRGQVEARGDQLSAEEWARLGVDDTAIERGIAVATTAWFRSLARQDPADHLREIGVPVLALFGERDIQVAADENAEAVRKALAAGQNPDHDVRILAGLNHLFQHAGTGGMEEYGVIEETFAPEALAAIGDWIESRFPAVSRRSAGASSR
jgi:hypothetical protein